MRNSFALLGSCVLCAGCRRSSKVISPSPSLQPHFLRNLSFSIHAVFPFVFQFVCHSPPTLVAFKSDNCWQSRQAKRENFQWEMSSYKPCENQQVGRRKQLMQFREKRDTEKVQYELHKTFWLDNHHACICFVIGVHTGRSICSTVLPQPVVKGYRGEMRWRKNEELEETGVGKD